MYFDGILHLNCFPRCVPSSQTADMNWLAISCQCSSATHYNRTCAPPAKARNTHTELDSECSSQPHQAKTSLPEHLSRNHVRDLSTSHSTRIRQRQVSQTSRIRRRRVPARAEEQWCFVLQVQRLIATEVRMGLAAGGGKNIQCTGWRRA